MKDCHIKPCPPEDIPDGLKGTEKQKRPPAAGPHPSKKYSKQANEDCTEHHELGKYFLAQSLTKTNIKQYVQKLIFKRNSPIVSLLQDI